MRQPVTAVACLFLLFFVLPHLAYSSSVFPPKGLDVTYQWDGSVVSEDDTLSVKIGETGASSIDAAIAGGLSSFVSGVATGTRMFVDIYKGEYKNSQLDQSYSYIYDGTPHELDVTWNEEAHYFVVVYGKNSQDIRGQAQDDFQAKMRPWFTSGDDSGFETSPPVLLQRIFPSVYAQSNPTDGIVVWGKREFNIIQAQPAYSSVAFLPGFQASRLYLQSQSPGTDRLWEPEGNHDLRSMEFDQDGSSKNNVVVGEAIDTINLFQIADTAESVYADFFAFLDELVSSGAIAGWQALPYDWRKNQKRVVTDEVRGLTASSTYRMIDQIEVMASSSDTGKVSLVGHSNGGLVGKLLISELQNQGKEDLIDKLIMVGTPQIGTPKAVGALLHGYDQRLGSGLIASEDTARDLAKTLPGAYGLLPSSAYFDQAQKPLIEFAPGLATQKFRDVYGADINTYPELHDFLTGTDRSNKPADLDDTAQPQPVSADLLEAYQPIYKTLSRWQASTSTKVTQIIGWGLPTVRGFEYFDKDVFCIEELLGGSCAGMSKLGVRPLFTNDGDQTVISLSANANESANTFFITLNRINRDFESITLSHKNITESHIFQDLIKSILKNSTVKEDKYLKKSTPSRSENSYLLTGVHSPADISISDGADMTGVAKTESEAKVVKEDVSGSRYVEIGESKYILAPKDGVDAVSVFGTGSGQVSVQIVETDSSGQAVASSTFSGVSVTSSTRATLSVDAGNVSSSTLAVDVDGNGSDDEIVESNGARIQKIENQQHNTNDESSSASPGGGGGRALIAEAGTDTTKEGEVLGAQTQASPSGTDKTADLVAETSKLSDVSASDVMQMNEKHLAELLTDIERALQEMLSQL